MGADGLSEEEKQFLIAELRRPLDLAALVAEVPNEMVAAEVYAASLLAIDLDTPAEAAYLRQLAQALRLDGATLSRLHEITGATRGLSSSSEARRRTAWRRGGARPQLIRFRAGSRSSASPGSAPTLPSTTWPRVSTTSNQSIWRIVLARGFDRIADGGVGTLVGGTDDFDELVDVIGHFVLL